MTADEMWTALLSSTHPHEKPVILEIGKRAGIIWVCKARRTDVYGECLANNYYALTKCRKCGAEKNS